MSKTVQELIYGLQTLDQEAKEAVYLRLALTWLIGRCPTDPAEAPLNLRLCLTAARNAADAAKRGEVKP